MPVIVHQATRAQKILGRLRDGRGNGGRLGRCGPCLERGKTAALLGSSGAGKSTLINRLLGEERLRTAPVRPDDSRGRHTTSHRELVVLPGGALLIDTPGMRELQLWTDEASLGHSFEDVEGLAAGCRFADCTHAHEPGRAVREAVAKGELDAARYESYLKQHRELRQLALKQDKRAPPSVRKGLRQDGGRGHEGH